MCTVFNPNSTKGFPTFATQVHIILGKTSKKLNSVRIVFFYIGFDFQCVLVYFVNVLGV